MEGYLLKWTNYLFGWQRRYLILYNGVLYYCKEKGSPQRGAIHLNISEVHKYPTNSKRFLISTGTTCIYFKAYTADEAQDWVRALKNQQLDLKYTKTRLDAASVSAIILDKVNAMWGIHSQLLNAIDLIPNSKSLEPITTLLNEMKNISANTLGIIEHEHEVIQKSPQKLNRYSCEGAPPEHELDESQEFEDAECGEDEIRRVSLPMLRIPKKPKNFWDSIKETINLTYEQILVPLKYYEPLSLLQRQSEEFLFMKILKKAAESETVDKCLAYILAYIAAGFRMNKRLTKPFNPIIGETFELYAEGSSVLFEQVNLNTSAMHCTGSDFTYHSSTEMVSQFVNGSLEIVPVGNCYFKPSKLNKVFTWNRPNVIVNGLKTGKISMEVHGDIRVTVNNSNTLGILHFAPDNIFGEVLEDNKSVLKVGVDTNIRVFNNKEDIQVTSFDDFEAFEYFYGFTFFTLQLNLPVVVFENLLDTDSRWRKDTRALENGNLQEAEKHYTKNRKFSEDKKNDFKAKWFKWENKEWVFNKKYENS